MLLALLLLPSFLFAASTPWHTNEHGRVRLISASDTAVRGETVWLGLHFQPQPGWYYYWKDPGEAGIPPAVNWMGTRGLTAPEILWPQPVKLILPGDIVEYGYQGEMVYPVRARVNRDTIEVHAKLSYLTCYTSCVPYTYTFSLDIPIGPNAVSDVEARDLIEKFHAQVPSLSDRDVKAKAVTVRLELNEGAPVAAPSAAKGPGLFVMVLFALVGGLILNVMPCVLPVLSIKLAGLLQHSHQSPAHVVQSSLASAAGILVSFWALAGLAIAARAAGHAVGWGIQFQNPWFVIFLMMVVLMFALNLWGVFEILTPRFLGHFATSFGYHETLTAHFVSGLFATLLATPCSAPFLGTALGFALLQPSGTILLIFTAVGVGLAMPYFALAAWPRSIRWLPKPGHWMVSLKKILSILLFLTAAWLGWVLSQQLHAKGPLSPQSDEWIPFGEADIGHYLQEGKPVLVDVTADWCVTCKYNERFVLASPAVTAEFKRRGMVLMRADWTNRNDEVASYLKKHGRVGIPFYAVYLPGRKPVVLSEFLTQTKVLEALR